MELPQAGRGDEAPVEHRRGELDVHLQLFLEPREGTEDFVPLGLELQVDVDRAGSPSVEKGRRASGQVEGRLGPRGRAERPKEGAEAPGVDVTPEELKTWLGERVAKWWVPERWSFIAEVPKTSVGKFDKKVLRARYAEGGLDVTTLG